MRRPFALTIVLLAAATLAGARAATDPAPFVVHEWGTFTSIAAEDGSAVEWAPQAGADDLPCFVVRSPFTVKGSLWGTVRMETPVLYFYTRDEMTVRVGVRFRHGVLTEWFPHAAVSPPLGAPSANAEGTIRWTNVRVTPGRANDFLIEPAASHYYAARQTDATPIASGADSEKFLFYRGVGTFAPPIAATIAGDGSVSVWRPGGQPIGAVVLFERRGDAVAFEIRNVTGHQATMALTVPKEGAPPPLAELQRLLVDGGLYEKEARAMIETWRDSWFDEGERLFYIAPAPLVDSILPIDITPMPARLARVFVGRTELFTPRTLNDVRDALASGDPARMARYGRFLQPLGNRLLAAAPPIERPTLERQLQSTYASWIAPPDRCRAFTSSQ
jgi:hypothetical protein